MATATSPHENDATLDTTFTILKNARRRAVIRYIRRLGPGETTTMSDLAEHVGSLENDCSVRELSSTERKRVYVALYQCHLDKLADGGAIEFDSDRKTVSRGERFDHYLKYLHLEDDDGHSGARALFDRLSPL